MSNLIAYQFKNSNIRIELKNNEPLFCLTDVANALNIKNAHSNRFNFSEKGIHKMYTQTKGGKQELIFIDEANLYRVIFRSNKKEAIDFQNWVFEEVLPSIRKTGSYSLTLNKRQQYLIRQAVLDNVAETANTFHSVYKKLYTRFNVYRYQDILAKDFDEAIELLGGVVNPIDNLPVLPNINQNGRWLLVVRNNQIAEVKSLKDYICVNKYRCI
ncbi:BRO-N domain-containing protein [Snodgrassella alvi]|uniref:BRO-N domain-containing protein n=1 Tax=Snodgrassella alvi TaxID=1196083 RepID=UPI000C1DC7A4|nr:BRO family protein [Snodgrassella alvi]PIT32590.1 hypothetical protein BHC42_07265 [Snodgrassella alvi]PIT34075.1 hypothetical protein BHC50_03890 [Snodgrassella alvi]WLT03741.1 BRO family protein [Snodgrassella alvi]